MSKQTIASTLLADGSSPCSAGTRNKRAFLRCLAADAPCLFCFAPKSPVSTSWFLRYLGIHRNQEVGFFVMLFKRWESTNQATTATVATL